MLVNCRVHRPTRSTHESLFIEGLPIFEHVVDGHGELVGDDALGFSEFVFALELLVALLDGR